jgi:hypothetical protein
MVNLRRIVWLIGILAVAAVVSATLDSAASKYLHGFDDGRSVKTALQRQRAANYTRPIVVGVPLEENAATKYRPVFAGSQPLAKDVSGQLGGLLKQGFTVNRQAADAFLAAYCGGARSPQFRDALRCTRCDWASPDPLESPGAETLLLGNCLVLSAQSSGHAGDWEQSAQSYFEAVSFACDLAQSDFWTNLVAISVATSALRGLTQLVESGGNDRALLQHLSRRLLDLEHKLPSVNVGISALATELSARVVAEAQARGRSLNRLGVFVPGTALAVWRLRRHETFLDKLEQAATDSDVERRVAFAREVQTYAATSGSDAFKALPTIIPEAIISAEAISLHYESLRAAIIAHEWRTQNGMFPIDVTRFPLSFRESRLRYEPIDGGKGYRIVVSSGYHVGEVIVAHEP